MQLNRLSLLAISSLALTLAGCPEPTDKSGREENMGGAGGSSSGGSGGSGSGGANSGGSSGSGSGGSSTGGAGGSGSGGSGTGGTRMDAASTGGAGGTRTDAATGTGGTRMDGSTGGGSDSGSPRSDSGGAPGSGTFSRDIFPILMKNCTTCHTGGMGIAGMGEQGAYTYLQGNHGAMCNGMTVKRCVALQYKLDPASVVMCGNKMPKGSMGVMDAAAIAKLKTWATAGCPM